MRELAPQKACEYARGQHEPRDKWSNPTTEPGTPWLISHYQTLGIPVAECRNPTVTGKAKGTDHHNPSLADDQHRPDLRLLRRARRDSNPQPSDPYRPRIGHAAGHASGCVRLCARRWSQPVPTRIEITESDSRWRCR